MLQKVSGDSVTVIGAARSGLAAARLLARHGAEVFVTDAGPIARETRTGLTQVGVLFEEGGHTDRALAADWAVISPGVPGNAVLPQRLREAGVPVYSEIEVASWFCEAPISAITGSNGKTTTTSLLAHVYRTEGRPVILAGNIGSAFCDLVEDVPRDGAVVLEVSSFQLDHAVSFRPHISVLLNITPDHLDRYDNSFEKYAESKYRIFENQTADDFLIFNADDEVVVRGIERNPPKARRLGISLEQRVEEGAFIEDGTIWLDTGRGEERLMRTEELTLKGRHNLYNSLAAAMAARVAEIRSDIVRESLSSFEGVPHRLEFVREVAGVRYVNDSKATNVNSLWYALESLSEPVVLIMGGRDKGNDYDLVRRLVNEKVKALLVIGESSQKVMDALGEEVPLAAELESMEEAVHFARRTARRGDVVLLSPACASFDMFENFEDRGNTFKRIVAGL